MARGDIKKVARSHLKEKSRFYALLAAVLIVIRIILDQIEIVIVSPINASFDLSQQVLLNFIMILVFGVLFDIFRFGSKHIYYDMCEGYSCEINEITFYFGQNLGRCIAVAFLRYMPLIKSTVATICIAAIDAADDISDIVKIIAAILYVAFILYQIYKRICYIVAPYVLADNPDYSAYAIMEASEFYMHGHVLDFIILNLSLVGWVILVILTLGIASLYVIPYFNLTYAEFYRSVKGDW